MAETRPPPPPFTAETAALLSGGLIGNTIEPSIYPAPRGMVVFLACSEQDPHIPLARLRQTEAMLEDLGADDVETRIYPGANHGINQQEPDKARRVVVGLGGS